MTARPEALQELLELQCHVVSRQQLLDLGLGRGWIAHRVRRGEWRRVFPGVFLTHTGEASFGARVWAALLHAGPLAVASHRTAGRLQGLTDDDPDVIEVSVPAGHRTTRQPGVRVRRRHDLPGSAHPSASPPQTRVEHTVIDLASGEDRPDDLAGWLTRACQRRLTTPRRLLEVLQSRSRARHRALLEAVLHDVSDGVASPLELRYARDVERRHGLPRAVRGSTHAEGRRRRYSDVRYVKYRVRVELEGLAYHPDDQRERDDARDNAALLEGDLTLRYGWRGVAGDALPR